MTAPSVLETVPVCCTDETWAPIPDWPHEASTCGRIRSIDRLGPDGVLRLGAILPQQPDQRPGKGYLYGTLLDGGRRRRVHVAVAVLEAHRGLKTSPNLEARHGNGIRTDNHLTNLSWGTRPQNRADRERHRNERAEMADWNLPASPAPGLMTLRQAIAAGWLPPNWSDPARAFSNAKCRAAKAGIPVPRAKAKDGAFHLYDTVELAAFLRAMTSYLTAEPGPVLAAGSAAGQAPAPRALGGLVTLKEAQAAGMFPASWSKPASVFRTMKHRAVKAGVAVPAVKAVRGARALYDAEELAAFLEAIDRAPDDECFRWFSCC